MEIYSVLKYCYDEKKQGMKQQKQEQVKSTDAL